MKKIILMAGIALFTSTIGFAQSSGRVINRSTVKAQKVGNFDPNQVADKRTERLDKIVSLTPEQKEKVRAIYLKDAENRKERVAANSNTQAEVESTLNDEQKHKLDEVKKQRMEKMKDINSDRNVKSTETIK